MKFFDWSIILDGTNTDSSFQTSSHLAISINRVVEHKTIIRTGSSNFIQKRDSFWIIICEFHYYGIITFPFFSYFFLSLILVAKSRFGLRSNTTIHYNYRFQFLDFFFAFFHRIGFTTHICYWMINQFLKMKEGDSNKKLSLQPWFLDLAST